MFVVFVVVVEGGVVMGKVGLLGHKFLHSVVVVVVCVVEEYYLNCRSGYYEEMSPQYFIEL